MAPKLQILVLISGSGTNLQALIDSVAGKSSPQIDAEIATVISSSPTAYGITRAKNADIPTIVHDLQHYYEDIPKDDKVRRREARKKFNVDLAEKVLNFDPDLIVCAGWMLILSPSFLHPISEKGIPIINLHPALPGQFDGINAIERAWQAGQRGEITKGGVMIHRVIKEVDRGEPLVVKELELKKEETIDEYEERVHTAEHIAIVEGTILALNEVKEKGVALPRVENLQLSDQ
ncbi:formyl transferase [Lipomyces tetrasporus]|uniref:Phosphoribosylglycinamide formyltransferase n=1 Tax=Lipomyces tetrasporus TaxID=54092 RepID=A0AAD7VRB3_9ASCO|nr:formyl transferase [Lipomyces tetrasporus]KAJ8099832.1 formyl transferase [Lipomyces tetrasporus]